MYPAFGITNSVMGSGPPWNDGFSVTGRVRQIRTPRGFVCQRKVEHQMRYAVPKGVVEISLPATSCNTSRGWSPTKCGMRSVHPRAKGELRKEAAPSPERRRLSLHQHQESRTRSYPARRLPWLPEFCKCSTSATKLRMRRRRESHSFASSLVMPTNEAPFSAWTCCSLSR